MTKRARPISEYNENMGDVLWWKFPITEPPYVGSPLDIGFGFEVVIRRSHEKDVVTRSNVGGWPGYHTHWTPIDLPADADGEDGDKK